MYLTYNEYTTMGGSLITATEFPKYEFLAETLINWYTFNRIQTETTIPTKIKQLMFILVDMIKKRDDSTVLGAEVASSGNTSGAVKSQSNDGVSITYNGMDAGDVYQVMNKECESVIKRYLYGVTDSLGRKLLYRGLYPGE